MLKVFLIHTRTESWGDLFHRLLVVLNHGMQLIQEGVKVG